jgi:hypothetical protein
MRQVALALLVAAAVAPAAVPAAQAAPAGQCFFSRDWKGWKAIDDKSMYVRVGLNKFYRVDFSSGCPELKQPNVHLITPSTTGTVCTALDLDIKVQQVGGPTVACVASKLTPLSADEVAAIPKKQLP